MQTPLPDNFTYKVTVIVPVYNAEPFLPQCLDSLLAQTIAPSAMEVLLIDDGSCDGSLAICERYAAQHPNFKVLHQENQGVSAARNAGIRAARGRYLMYLDGDDTLSPETVKNVTDFFDEHARETDIVAYPILFCYEDGRQERHSRDNILTQTGVYRIDTTLYISLTTINAAVKNRGENTPVFDEALSYHEDEAYLTDIAISSGSIGYVREASYLYRRHGNAASSLLNSPYYIFESSTAFYEKLVEKYTVNGKLHPYAQTVILNDFNWKIRQDRLFPYHYDSQHFLDAVQRLRHIISDLDVETILKCPYMDPAHKFYLLSLREKDRPFAAVSDEQIDVLNSQGTLWSNHAIQLAVEQCKTQGDTLYLLGYLKNYAFAFMEKPQLFAVVDGVYHEVPLFLSQHSCYWTDIQTDVFWAFHFDMDLGAAQELEFVVRARGKELKTSCWFSNRQSVQPDIKRPYLNARNYSLLFADDRWSVVPRRSGVVKRLERRFNARLLLSHPKKWLARQYMRKRSGKKIWLYQDSRGVIDNAYYQFLHDYDKNDGVERYYVCQKDSISVQELFSPAQQKALVEFGSRRHKKLFVQADKLLVSFLDHAIYMPFHPDVARYYHDLFCCQVVYLQHGVMHAKIPRLYSKEKTYMVDKVVVSTVFEKENLIRELGFREADLLCTGMPRLDRLTNTARQKKLLFAPSWRNYLATWTANGWEPQSRFESSDYFKAVCAFLTSPELTQLLEQNDYTLDVKLHPIFRMYRDSFQPLASGRIHLVDTITLGEYTACITDFTSFMYDFFYLGVPVVCHIFDIDRFKAGLHSYRELFWDLEKDYPHYCPDLADVFSVLQKIIQSPARYAEDTAALADQLYFSREGGHAQRVYECLKEG